jgi:hypothetical protein
MRLGLGRPSNWFVRQRATGAARSAHWGSVESPRVPRPRRATCFPAGPIATGGAARGFHCEVLRCAKTKTLTANEQDDELFQLDVDELAEDDDDEKDDECSAK